MLGRVERTLRRLGKKRNDELGAEVERLMKNEMAWITNRYILQYRHSAFDIFSWTTDDLRQQIRVIMWRGLAVYKKDRGVKVTTYLSAVLFHWFISFSRRCHSKKNSQARLHCVDQLFYSSNDVEGMDDMDRSDNRADIEYFFSKLTPEELSLFEFYNAPKCTSCKRSRCKGRNNKQPSFADAAKCTGVPAPQISTAMKTIRRKMRDHVDEIDDEVEGINYDDTDTES